MRTLSEVFAGLVRVCDKCGAVLAYGAHDVYENKYIYCPVCRAKLEVPLAPVEEEKK